jgi:hypothetical protein
VLTPDVGQSFPDLLFFTYFVTHSGALAAACLLVFGSRGRLDPMPSGGSPQSPSALRASLPWGHG